MTGPVVHLIGLGSMGTLLAVDLLRFTDATLIPLFRSKKKLDHFRNEGSSTIGIRKLYLKGSPLLEARIETASCPETFQGPHIDNLIVTTKTYQTKDALTPYLSYIDSKTNLILVQNGLGVLELLKEQVFVNPSKRPNLFQGVIGHGVFQDTGYIYNHAGQADLKVARLPWDDSENGMIQNDSIVSVDSSNNELMRLLCEPTFSKEFKTIHMTYQELLLGQLFKFLINCCMNPVTAIVDADNGEIGDSCAPIFKLIIDESLKILELAYSPLFEYKSKFNGKPGYPCLDVDSVLNADNILKQTIHYGCHINGKNSSSMRQDTLYLRDTEIDYINGYLVTLAKKFELGEDACKVSSTVKAFVELRLGLNRYREQSHTK